MTVNELMVVWFNVEVPACNEPHDSWLETFAVWDETALDVSWLEMVQDPATLREDAASVVAFRVEDTVSVLNVDEAPVTDPVKVVVPVTESVDKRVAAPETVSGPVRLTLCPTRLTAPFPACTTTPVGLLYTAVLMTKKGHIKKL